MAQQRLKDIHTIIFHVLETKEDQNVGVRIVREWHIERGFDDIGYHFVLRFDGTIELGRLLTTVGAHVRGNNNNTIGIAFEGGFGDVDMRTAAQKSSALRLLTSLAVLIKPTAKVRGHNDYTDEKECPNFVVEEEYRAFMRISQAKLHMLS